MYSDEESGVRPPDLILWLRGICHGRGATHVGYQRLGEGGNKGREGSGETARDRRGLL